MKHAWPLAICLLTTYHLYGHSNHSAEREPLGWTKEKTEYANVQVKIAGPGEVQNSIQVVGKVRLHPDLVAYVIPKVNGSVYQVSKHLGDVVEKDEPLAILESRQIAEAKALYLNSLRRYVVQKHLYDQEMFLVDISPRQDYLQAELALNQAEVDLQLATQTLYTMGFSQQEIQKIPFEKPEEMRFYTMKAPLKGKVLERNLTQGELLDQSKTVFTIGGFEKLFVEVHIPQNDIPRLKKGLPVEIASVQGGAAQAQIAHFSPTICEETRTATALVLIENGGEEWAPGQFVTAHIQTESLVGAIVIPLAALQCIDGQNCVFVEEGDSFKPRVVKTGKRDRENIEIVSGLLPGTSYAAFNTFCLKADHEKGEGEHHH